MMDAREMNFLGVFLGVSMMSSFVRYFYPLLSPMMFVFTLVIYLVTLHIFGWIFYIKLIIIDYLLSIYSIYEGAIKMAGCIQGYKALDIIISEISNNIPFINYFPDSPLTWFIILNIWVFSIQLIVVPLLRTYLSHGQFLNRITEAIR
jgi:hypothetical protein